MKIAHPVHHRVKSSDHFLRSTHYVLSALTIIILSILSVDSPFVCLSRPGIPIQA